MSRDAKFNALVETIRSTGNSQTILNQALNHINESVQTIFRIDDRIDMNRRMYDRVAGQREFIKILALLPECDRVRFIETVTLQCRGYLKVANTYFDRFCGGNFTTAWGGNRFINIDYDWNNFVTRAGKYVKTAEEKDLISTLMPSDSIERFEKAAVHCRHSSAFFTTIVPETAIATGVPMPG